MSSSTCTTRSCFSLVRNDNSRWDPLSHITICLEEMLTIQSSLRFDMCNLMRIFVFAIVSFCHRGLQCLIDYRYNVINHPFLLYKIAKKTLSFFNYVLSSISIRSRCARTRDIDHNSSSINCWTTSRSVSSSKKFNLPRRSRISSSLFFCWSCERFEYCFSKYLRILFLSIITYPQNYS